MVACSVGPRLGPGERRGLGQWPGVVAALVVGYGGAGRYGDNANDASSSLLSPTNKGQNKSFHPGHEVLLQSPS